MQDAQTLAEKAIRLHLAARNKNQAWLAAQLGESTFWVGRRLNGAIAFKITDLERIAALFGRTVDELLTDADKIPTGPQAVAS
ncbi:helix-turn-helix domain-containing protein [Microbacterium sp. YY-01]|uniref:helix-turn-helix domain-containing protein n=1 Tax=Microbacterium sp. YY-01 TaxID=3421634 RepID=UPI003D16E02F